ncbi:MULTISPECIES: plasmid replication protein RepC [Rhizobium/Agrobacterium group]|uniref:plasmid replication protein RepC n=1 Tax=Rhizobium/Agrobacterium group TaxID=227290 RepID=UPI001ADC5607|nr:MULTISPECIES: plasmid replication protein RepC [Rhizobium/Agrobacterium group]MBO9111930.1 replication initiation protein RepC [Agrobacterium sp. S2/73]QXZ76292.1 replication initiation protein RepC [Agrobacterium sp. S7/73]QYA17162.1 replication initiation protein RepC [Rhizobium sp. AB2/73]UEQ85265.1 replication initiation protein RepC [Rhizobium sp. AB2/73]
MERGHGTTPFGRRSMTFALLARQRQIDEAPPETRRNKWKLFRAVCEARKELNVSDRSLSVLDALLSFYPSDDLALEDGLIVFPSNAQLSIRARGMTPATLRRHLAALVNAGLILRKDSANGKRFARRSRAGEINEAFGFNLAPLLSRAKEIEDIAAKITADRELFHATRERISLCRRDITKLIQLAIDGCVEGEWSQLHDRFRAFLASLPRQPSLDELQFLLSRLIDLRTTIVKLLEEHDKMENMCARESQNERHIQDSQTQSCYESEAEQEAPTAETFSEPATTQSAKEKHRAIKQTLVEPIQSLKPAVALDTVLRACGEIHPYGPDGSIRSWRDLLAATAVLRSMLQISPSAFHQACLVMGPENAGAAIACIFEKGGQINSAGAYLRDLTRRATQRQFTIKPMVSALLRSKAGQS